MRFLGGGVKCKSLRSYFCFSYSVPGLMEHDSIPGISSSRPIGSRSFGHTHPVVTVETILSKLTDVVDCLTRNYLDPSLTQQILRQVTVHCVMCIFE